MFKQISDMFSDYKILKTYLFKQDRKDTATVAAAEDSVSILYTKDYKLYMIKICNYFLELIDNNSDFILFTKELESVIIMLQV